METGGADHLGCDYTTGNAIEVCASFGNSARVSALFEAELSECSMGGNLCGVSTGEALSRWCAAVVGNNVLSDSHGAAVGPGRDAGFRRPDRSHDQNPDSIGAGMAFLSWLMSQGYSLGQIAPAMVSLGTSGTLAQLYANLTGNAASNACLISKLLSRTCLTALPTTIPLMQCLRPHRSSSSGSAAPIGSWRGCYSRCRLPGNRPGQR